MFMDGKYLQITQSNDSTNWLWSVLHGRPGSDLPLKLHVLVKYAELPLQATRYKLVHLCGFYTLKLQLLVHSFGACQRCYYFLFDLILFDFIWVYIIIYEFIWVIWVYMSYMSLYDFIWVYLILYDFIWFYMILYDFILASWRLPEGRQSGRAAGRRRPRWRAGAEGWIFDIWSYFIWFDFISGSQRMPGGGGAEGRRGGSAARWKEGGRRLNIWYYFLFLIWFDFRKPKYQPAPPGRLPLYHSPGSLQLPKIISNNIKEKKIKENQIKSIKIK